MIAALLAVAAVAAPPPTAPSRDPYGASVVGVVVSYQGWDEQRPWVKKNPGVRRGSGVVVEGKAILTTAEMVAGATLVQLETFGRATHVEAEVAAVDPECNLALLSVSASGFFDDLKPVQLAAATPTEGTLRTVRWQSQQLEASASRVKRIQVEESWYGVLEHAFLQVQTDLVSGGWGEPVFTDDHLVGLTVSQGNDQRARVIPVEVVSRFVSRARAPGGYRAFPVFGVKWQVNEDRALAAWLGQSGPPAGIVIRQVPWGSSGCGSLQPLDILLAVDGLPIDANGFVTHPSFGRVGFAQLLVERHVAGDSVPLRVLRKGHEISLSMTLRDYPVADDLIPARRWNQPPSYAIVGGLVFRELDGEYLRSWGGDWFKDAPLRLTTMYSLFAEAQTPERRRIVILSGVLPSSYNIGYQDLEEIAVAAVNGRPVASMDDLVGALGVPVDGLDTVTFEPNALRSEIVLDAASLDAATAEILKTFGISGAVRLPAAPLPDPGPACAGMF